MGITMRFGKTVKTKKRRIKILSVSKFDEREVWTFKKEQAFLPALLNFLLEIGFSGDDFEIQYFFGVPHKENHEGGEDTLSRSYLKNPFSKKYFKINLFSQEIYSFRKKDLDVEVIFFENKIVLITRINKKSIHVGELISKFADF